MRNTIGCGLVVVILAVAFSIAAFIISLIGLSRNDCYPPHKDDQVARFVLKAKTMYLDESGGGMTRLIARVEEGSHESINWGDLDLWVINIAEQRMIPAPPSGQKPKQLIHMATHSIIRQWIVAQAADPKVTGMFVAFQDQTAPLGKPFTRRAYVIPYVNGVTGVTTHLVGSGYFVRRHCWYRNDYTHDPLGHD